VLGQKQMVSGKELETLFRQKGKNGVVIKRIQIRQLLSKKNYIHTTWVLTVFLKENPTEVEARGS
jgi:hypothetical protein